MVQNAKKYLLVCLGLLLCIALSSCESRALTNNEQKTIAEEYFLNTHKIQVTYESSERIQVGYEDYYTETTVRCGRFVYHVMLDEHNRPIADDVTAQKAVQETDLTAIRTDAASKGFSVADAKVVYSLKEYEIRVTFSTRVLLDTQAEQDLWNWLTVLKELGIQGMWITQEAPDFFEHSIQLSSTLFSTDMLREEFSEAYQDLATQVTWDREKFEDVLLKAEEAGCSIAKFHIEYIYSRKTGYELLIQLEYWDGDSEEIQNLVSKMDASYFYHKSRAVHFTAKQDIAE